MKINEALNIINSTRTVRAKFENSKLTFATKKMLGDGHWGFWFLRMNEAASGWYSVNFEYCYLDGASPQDLARTMDVVQRLIDTPVDERGKKYRLVAVRYSHTAKYYVTKMFSGVDEVGFELTTNKDRAAVLNERGLDDWKNREPGLAQAIDAMKEEAKDYDNAD